MKTCDVRCILSICIANASFPVGTLYSVYMSERESALVLSPHPDDSELGAGGTMSKLAESGYDLTVVAFSRCELSLPDGDEDVLEAEFTSAMGRLGPSEHYLFEYPVRRFDEHRQAILEQLVELREVVDPDLVIGPSLDDVHQDHTVVAEEMVRAFKMDAKVISYELPWNHVSFDTQLFYRLEDTHLNEKLALLDAYHSQRGVKDRSYFREEFVRGLAAVRGVQCNAPFAEAFSVIRWHE